MKNRRIKIIKYGIEENNSIPNPANDLGEPIFEIKKEQKFWAKVERISGAKNFEGLTDGQMIGIKAVLWYYDSFRIEETDTLIYNDEKYRIVNIEYDDEGYRTKVILTCQNYKEEWREN